QSTHSMPLSLVAEARVKTRQRAERRRACMVGPPQSRLAKFQLFLSNILSGEYYRRSTPPVTGSFAQEADFWTSSLARGIVTVNFVPTLTALSAESLPPRSWMMP